MRKFFISLVVLITCLQLVACSDIPVNVAEALAETTAKGGHSLWSVPLNYGETLIAICRPEGTVDIVKVSGSVDSPRIVDLDIDIASCGERHQFWQKYDNAMTTYKKEIVRNAMTSLKTEMDK